MLDNAILPKDHSEHVMTYAEEYDIPPELVFAVIKIESGSDANARSVDDCIGLMQLSPTTFEWLTSAKHLGENLPHTALYQPEVNIKYGCYYLRYLKNRFDSWEVVLAAYNAGEGNVSKWLKDPKYADGDGGLQDIPFPETASYVTRVTRAWEYYKEQ